MRAVVSMSTSLGLYLVAEGVETIEQHEALRELGCHQGQGWLWSKAVTGADVVPVVRRLAAVASA